MESVDGWTKRQWRQRDNGWSHLYPHEDECCAVSPQPGSCLGPGHCPSHPSRSSSPSRSTKNDSPHSLKYSQAPAPPKQASECPEHVDIYERAPGFEEKPPGTDACREGTLSHHSPPGCPGLLSLPRCSCSSLKKQERKNKSMRHEDKYAFRVAANSSGRAVVVA